VKLGAIGDDFTGSSDLANTLAKGGMRSVQYCAIPSEPADRDVEAGVVSLKSRSVPVADAVEQSLLALDWLLAQGCTQILFKYCSTFDSTMDGNIGPVAEALYQRLGGPVIVCPAFPATGRSVYQGHLFVNDRLLSESGMENHPLTPMSDPDLRRWLGHQTSLGIGHVTASVVAQGKDAIAAAIEAQLGADKPLIVVDAIADAELIAIGQAAKTHKLITGGSGIALGLPANFGAVAKTPAWAGTNGRAALLSGSCSIATRGQIRRYALSGGSTHEISAAEVMSGAITAQSLADWALSQDTPLIYSSADPEIVKAAQAEFGRAETAAAIEQLFADLAKFLTKGGVERLITAGGETSGAVVEGLQIEALEIGPEIAPGVPAVRDPNTGLCLALKSGNFGSEDFFAQALEVLHGD